ncbi:hypothetical protein CRUP_019917, partial [Coryphaenoides rupestris]
IHQALRKGFQHLESNQKTWRSVLAECTPLVGTSVRDSTGGHVTAAVQLYERDAGGGGLDLHACTQRSPAAPSLTDMLEWLQNAELYYKQHVYTYSFMGMM